MGETKTVPMAHFKGGSSENSPCSNESPVTFTKGEKYWRPSSWDSAKWGHHPGRDPAKYGTLMVCMICGGDVRKIDP